MRSMKLGIAGLATTLAAICLTQAPHAYADPYNDFLTALNKNGIDLGALMGVSNAVALGQYICGDLHDGNSPAGEADALTRMTPLTDKQAPSVVFAAQFAYCPDTLGNHSPSR